MSHRLASPHRRQENPSVIVMSDGRPGQILPGRGPLAEGGEADSGPPSSMELELALIAQPGSLREETQRLASLQARRTRSRRG